jgi:hypothetical protein
LPKNSIALCSTGAALGLLAAPFSAPMCANTAETISTWQGVYTKNQGARGKSHYFKGGDEALLPRKSAPRGTSA